jgi:hypothetical protein
VQNLFKTNYFCAQGQLRQQHSSGGKEILKIGIDLFFHRSIIAVDEIKTTAGVSAGCLTSG